MCQRNHATDIFPANALVQDTTADAFPQIGAPTNTEYIKAAGIGFLETLAAVSSFAPKPVPEIVQIGVALIKAFDVGDIVLLSRKLSKTHLWSLAR